MRQAAITTITEQREGISRTLERLKDAVNKMGSNAPFAALHELIEIIECQLENLKEYVIIQQTAKDLKAGCIPMIRLRGHMTEGG